MEGVTKGLDKAMKSMDLEKVHLEINFRFGNLIDVISHLCFKTCI